jgi:2-oxoglutarate dehydrogenase E1 component
MLGAAKFARAASRHRWSQSIGRSTRALATSSNLSEDFLDGTSSNYVDHMYREWMKDSSSVHKSWDVYFRAVAAGAPVGQAHASPPTLGASPDYSGSHQAAAPVPISGGLSAVAGADDSRDKIGCLQLINGFRKVGHTTAKLDPLGLRTGADLDDSFPEELMLEHYGFSEADLDKQFSFTADNNMSGIFGDGTARTLRQIIGKLEEYYCKTWTVEFMHVHEDVERNWLISQIEQDRAALSSEEKALVLERVAEGELFERFLAKKFVSAKRFGLEGCETAVLGLKYLIDTSADLGVESVVLGMPHRGRLNTLVNVVGKPLEQLLCEFQGAGVADNVEGSGDVKYHLGMSHERRTRSGKDIHLSLMANPSHLEAVNPLVEGKARAKQHYSHDTERKRVLPVLLHGDAAFSGQGVVFETQALSGLADYNTGGSIQVVVNNQIGFTTDPECSRSSPYCTDVAKAIAVPVFHVNADDAEAVRLVFQLAAEYRQKFGKEAVVDLVGYRRHGHNEIDEPMFTQPQMYKHIKQHKTVYEITKEKYLADGSLTAETVASIEQKLNGHYEAAFEAAKTRVSEPATWLESSWAGFKGSAQLSRIRPTGVDVECLAEIGAKLATIPEGFNAHKGVQRVMKAKAKAIESRTNIDWATAEALAFASLLREGNHVRISGQDVQRGTFSHRHCVLTDQMDGSKYLPINSVADGSKFGSLDEVTFRPCNSNLTEYATLGFELGYASENPNSLIIWEAQFGDFANTAQVIIDQFVCSGESKWLRQNGLVMLLPHGFEGQGPEHSSARLERYLQMSDDDPRYIPETEDNLIQNCNWQVVNCTSPANYFHVLRRQVHREFRKPLVVMAPKSILRLKDNVSDLSEMAEGSSFKRTISERQPENLVADDQIKKIVFCTGKVYYEIRQERNSREVDDMALITLEQISPFPYSQVMEDLKKYPNADVMWCQEEPLNMGAWSYVEPRMLTALRKGMKDGREITYHGRKPEAAPGTGFAGQHGKEITKFMNELFA